MGGVLYSPLHLVFFAHRVVTGLKRIVPAANTGNYAFLTQEVVAAFC